MYSNKYTSDLKRSKTKFSNKKHVTKINQIKEEIVIFKKETTLTENIFKDLITGRNKTMVIRLIYNLLILAISKGRSLHN